MNNEMKSILSSEKTSFNAIFKEVYELNDDGTTTPLKPEDQLDSIYKSYATASRKKLVNLFKAMGIDITLLKEDSSHYSVPPVIAEVLKVYLIDKGGRETFVSKINQEKFDEITVSEKFDFIKKVITALRKRFENHKSKDLIYKEIDIVEKNYKEELNFEQKVECFESVILGRLKNEVKKISNVSGLNGIVQINSDYNKWEEPQKAEIELLKDKCINPDMENKHYQESDYSNLNRDDIIVLLKQLTTMTEEVMNSWEQLVDIFDDMRNDEFCEENDNITTSEELLKSALEELNSTSNIKDKSDRKNFKDINEELKDFKTVKR